MEVQHIRECTIDNMLQNTVYKMLKNQHRSSGYAAWFTAGVQSASPKTPKNTRFLGGHPAPRGRTAPIFYGTQLDPDI